MTVSELSAISAIGKKQIQKRWKEVPGASKVNGVITFPDGSRFPFDLHRYKLDSHDKRRVALLDSVSHYRYVDHVSLKMPEASFKTLIEELVTVGLIRKNGVSNPYGANRYDTTIRYDEIKDFDISKRITKVANLIASTAGYFAGAFCDKIIPA